MCLALGEHSQSVYEIGKIYSCIEDVREIYPKFKLSGLFNYTFRFDNGKIIPTLLNCMLVILVRNVMSGMHSMYYISSSDLFKVAHYKLSSLSFPRTKNVSVGS